MGVDNMKRSYVIEYLDENEFNKRERALKRYNMIAFKKLAFDYSPKLKEGYFLGKVVGRDETIKATNYELSLPTDDLFVKVHGEVVLHYSVYDDSNIIVFKTITPDTILDEGHRTELKTYKGVVLSKDNSERDKFKIDLLNMIQH